VLGGVSDAELDALVSKLRTDKNRIVPAANEPRSRWERHSEERLHRSRPLVSSVPEEAVAGEVWHVALGAKASGPHDVEALRGYWERGELGPDSLCWREGFSAWVPVCQVPELAEALAPLPQERLPEPVPVGDMDGQRFELKGTEALRSLAEEDDPFPELDLKAARVELSAPVSTREPVLGFTGVDGGTFAPAPMSMGTPAPVAAYPRGDGFTEAGNASVDPVGTHAVLVTQPASGEVRWRSALGLALLSGVAGGVTVAVVLALMGRVDGSALLARLSSRDAVGVAGASTAPGAGQVGAGAPGVMGTGAAPAAGVVASPGALGAGAAPGAGASPGTPPGAGVTASPGMPGGVASAAAGATGPGAVAGSSLAGAVAGIDRGGSVPVLSGTGGTAAPAPSVIKSSPASELATVSPPPRAPVARQAVPAAALALEKRPVGPPPVTETSFESEEDLDVEAAPAVEEKPAAALGPDEDFERELAEPPPGSEDALKERTVYVPPDPAKAPASLAQSDIFEVVLANKGDITACAAEQQAGPKEGGRVVVRWSILPSGKVDDVVTETASIKGTPLASCIEAKVRAWTFPKHQEQGAPVRFPFVF
jgi:hypothetical protein